VRESSRKGALRTYVAVVCLAGHPQEVRGQTPDVAKEGTVVQVELDDMVLDLGSLEGAATNAIVEVWRPIRVKHPVTGKVLVDRFLFGHLRLIQVGSNLSLAQAEGTLMRVPQAGDVVVLRVPTSATPTTSTSTSTSTSTPTPTATALLPYGNPTPSDDEARSLSELFDTLRGADVAARIHAYESYIGSHAHGRHVQVLWEEITGLRKLLGPGDAVVPSDGAHAVVAPIDRATAGEPLRIAIALEGDAKGAVLHARISGEPTYSSLPMANVGGEYWAATIPGDAVKAPQIEWFVEAVAPDGEHPVVGDPTSPDATVVEDVSPKAARRVLGEAKIWTDYASFNVKAPNDYVWQTEGVMGARFDDQGIRAVRSGFGVYRGVGGTLEELDVQHQAGTPVGLTYGYLEGEFGATARLSFVARAIVGLRETGVNGGASAFVRIGSDFATNLLLGGEVLGGIGLRGVAEFDWNSFWSWPIVVRSEVTNQPAGIGSDVGVRLIGQVGYRVLPHLVVAARGSYQGRTIYHSGPGAGASVEYAW
jgi:hypothetical protein